MIVLGDCSSDPALSGVRGLNSELKPENNSFPLSPYSQIIYKHTQTLNITSSGTRDHLKHRNVQIPAALL